MIDHYEPDIVSANDYYPFGMLQPGRSYLSPNGNKYRYGFNGKENDNEVKGDGNQQDYGMRVYDPRLGRFLSRDPLTKEYPWNSPYSYAEGDVIRSIDLDGLEKFVVTNIHDKYGRRTRASVDGISTIESDGAIKAINMQLKRANGTPLTNQDVYDIHMRSGTVLSDRQRSGGLTNTEINALRNAKDAGDRDESFDKEYGTSGEDQELGRSFPLRVGDVASVIRGSSYETHKYFDAPVRYPQSAPTRLLQNLGGSSWIGASMSSGSSGIGFGSGSGININDALNYQVGNINAAVSDFISKNGLNVAFVDNITLTIGNNTYRTQWNTIQRSLQRTYNTTVNIVVDPYIEGRNAGYSNPASITTSAGYLSVSVNMSGVTNGNVNYAAPGARTK